MRSLVFPMEVGSILAGMEYLKECEVSLVGIVYCPHQSYLRKIFAQDCGSRFSKSQQKLITDYVSLFDSKEVGRGWESARNVYNYISLQDRLAGDGQYTEGFVRDPTPAAIVVYGVMENLSSEKKHVVEKFRKNGYDIYNLIPSI